MFRHTKLRAAMLLAATLLASALVVPQTQQPRATSAWTPPAPRLKEKTLFAPKPHGGDNIFKGEAESWLADAIVKLEGDELTPIKDKQVAAYVSQVGKNLVAFSAAPSKQFEFIVLDDEEVNASSVGDGRIYINLGMLREVGNEDELAGIIAHEIAHDAFGHAPKTVTRQLFWMKGVRKIGTPVEAEDALESLLEEYEKKPLAVIGESLLGFARFDELEADRAAFYNVYKAGYNPRALAEVLKRVEREMKGEMDGDEYRMEQFLKLLFGSHPPTAQRSMALSWESNFVKMPKKEERRSSAAFDEMKARVAKL
jgi:beta-barrel assembly-enhancing protease